VSRGTILLCVIGRGAPVSLFTVWDQTFLTNGRVGLAALPWSEDR